MLASGVAVDSAGAVYRRRRSPSRSQDRREGSRRQSRQRHGGVPSGDGGPATRARLNAPSGVAVDSAGVLYIADFQNGRIRRVDKNGVMSTVAGSGRAGFSGDGGPATRASLNGPNRVAVDPLGALYVADVWNNRIRKIDTSGIITTVAGNGRAGFSGDGGPATRARVDWPSDVAVSAQGTLYIADSHNRRIRAVASHGVITTVAGGSHNEFTGDGGPATSAVLCLGYMHGGIALDSHGAVYIRQTCGGIRKMDRNGIITTPTLAPVPDVTSASGIAVDMAGAIYIASDDRIRKIDPQGTITPVAGNGILDPIGDGGPATRAGMSIVGIAVDRAGAVFIADNANNRVRKVDANGIITTVAGNGMRGSSGDGGLATAASVGRPSAIAVDGDGVCHSPAAASAGSIGSHHHGGRQRDGRLQRRWRRCDECQYRYPQRRRRWLRQPLHRRKGARVREVDTSGIITTVAGDGIAGFRGDGGPGNAARLNEPVGLAVTSDGTLFISDWGNQRIRMVVGRP